MGKHLKLEKYGSLYGLTLYTEEAKAAAAYHEIDATKRYRRKEAERYANQIGQTASQTCTSNAARDVTRDVARTILRDISEVYSRRAIHTRRRGSDKMKFY